MHVLYTHYVLHMYIKYIYMYNVHTLFIHTHTHTVYVCCPSPKNASSKKAKILFFHHCNPRV